MGGPRKCGAPHAPFRAALGNTSSRSGKGDFSSESSRPPRRARRTLRHCRRRGPATCVRVFVVPSVILTPGDPEAHPLVEDGRRCGCGGECFTARIGQPRSVADLRGPRCLSGRPSWSLPGPEGRLDETVRCTRRTPGRVGGEWVGVRSGQSTFRPEMHRRNKNPFPLREGVFSGDSGLFQEAFRTCGALS